MPPYSQLNEKQINEIVAVFGIGRVIQYKALEGGSENTNYRIDTHDKSYVLTLSENKSKEKVSELADLLTHLEKNGVRSSRVLPTNCRDYLSSYVSKPILLKEYLHGDIIENLSEEMLFDVGASMAVLHAVPVPQNMENRFQYGIDILTVPDSLSDHPFSAWVADIRKYICEHLDEGLRKGLIHGDIFFNNVVITEDTGPVIIDFEEAGHYYLVFDLGMAIVGTCCDAGVINMRKVKALVRGYQSKSSLNSIEVTKLKAFVAYAASVTACWRFAQYRALHPDESKQDRYLEMKQIADEIRAVPNASFESACSN